MKAEKKNKSYWWAWFFAGAVFCSAFVYFNIFYLIEEPVLNFLNSNFSTAFFGAVGGSLTIILLERLRYQRLLLADINTSIGILVSLSNTLLNMKRQHTLPMYNHYQANVREFKIAETVRRYSGSKEPIIYEIQMFMSRFQCPELDYDLPTERIFSLTDKAPQIVPVICQTKRSVSEIKHIYATWNALVENMKEMEQGVKIAAYFGRPNSDDMSDTIFPDTIHNLHKTVDDALFFIQKSTTALNKLGKKTLPFWLKSKVARSELFNKEYEALLPSKDHIEGWDDVDK